ncbi:unnamed protein product [Tenebrio molitor]|nr:unnamed protein product [Tenebrio molitor]
MNTVILTCLVLSVLIFSVTCNTECKEGESKKEECNSCRCANGLWVCTRKACAPRKTRGIFILFSFCIF